MYTVPSRPLVGKAPSLTDIDSADLSIFPPAARPHIRNWLKLQVVIYWPEHSDDKMVQRVASDMRDSDGYGDVVSAILNAVNKWEWLGDESNREDKNESHDAIRLPSPTEMPVVLQLAELIADVNACAFRHSELESDLSTWRVPNTDKSWDRINQIFLDLNGELTDMLTREVEAARKAVANG
jgi:hypothetical protein